MIPSCLRQFLPSFTHFANCTFPISLLILSSSASRYVSREKRKPYALVSRCSGKVKLDSSPVIRSIFVLSKRGRLGQDMLPEHPGVCALNLKQSSRKGKTSECSRHPPCANTHHPRSSRVRLAIL